MRFKDLVRLRSSVILDHKGRAVSADQLVLVSEMLPGPEDSWLELDGERYTSELRIAAVDLTRREHAKIEIG